ncbi:MAG: sigma-70 family RNA polymerase sigma factor [Planctomycetota bacterium]|nr:sigma-70 family RNA polymerase sigma factor [Planctomycetota bacterium]
MTSLSIEESELLSALKRGDSDAYERLVREYGGRLYAAAYRVLGRETDAQDAVQDAFVSAFRALDTFEGQSMLSTWLYRITVNAALQILRKRRNRPERSMDDLLPGFYEDGHRKNPKPTWSPLSDERVQQEETRELIREKISELPEDFSNVITLRDISGLDTEQTAQVLDIEPGAVRTRLHRARQALRTLLEEEYAT